MPPIAASAELAKEKGAFPLFDRDEFLARPNIQRLPQDIRDGIAAHGIRNGLLTSIAPTGTISLFAGNVSSGIEPVFAYSYTRKVLRPDGARSEEQVEDYACAPFRAEVRRRCARCRTISSARRRLSPRGSPRRAGGGAELHRQLDLQDHQRAGGYFLRRRSRTSTCSAYESGCKGCTTYRPTRCRGAVLELRGESARAELQTAR